MRHLLTFCFSVLVLSSTTAQSWVNSNNELGVGSQKNFLRVSAHEFPTTCIAGNGCDGSAYILPDGGIQPYHIVWSDGFVGNFRDNLCQGDYSVVVSDASGHTASIRVTIEYNDGCVWPGDADGNRQVDNKDLLAIALTYGESGFPRNAASTAWQGQEAQNWQTIVPIEGLPNYKHIDTDGNGIINQNDVQALQNNYGQHYNTPASYTRVPSGNAIPLGVRPATGRKGDRISTDLYLGTPSQLANNVYGIAYTIKYNPDYFQAGSGMVDFEDSWLAIDPIHIQKLDSDLGTIQVAVARKDRINNTGFGNIGKLFLTIRDDVFRTDNEDLIPYTDIVISDIQLIDNANNVINVDAISGTITIENTISSTPHISVADDLRVYPNPAKQAAYIELPSDVQVQNIQMHNASGKLVYQSFEQLTGTHNIQTNDLPAGIYCVSVVTDKKVLIQKLHIVK